MNYVPKLATLFLILFSSSLAYSQTPFTMNNYANAGDSVWMTNATTGLNSFNFTATGANTTWNYATLPIQSQKSSVFLNPTNAGYYTTFLAACIAAGGNAFICPPYWGQATNIAARYLDSVTIGPAVLSDLILHSKKANDLMISTLIGAKVDNGGPQIKAIVAYDIPDTVLRFPLTYLKIDSCKSKFTVNLVPSGINIVYKSNLNRINTVQGWGTLITPRGTFTNVLKVKTELIQNDTLINTGVVLPAGTNKLIYYSWYNAGNKFPILVVETRLVGNNYVTQNIQFIDTIRCLAPKALFVNTPLFPTINPSTGNVNVNFINSSNNSNTYNWNFGNGQTANTQNPTATYTAAGTYEVRLISCNTSCLPNRCDTLSSFVIVTDTSFVKSQFSVTPKDTFCLGDSVHFNNASQGGLSYVWSFGDNTNSTQANPSKLYTSAGNYTVRLIAIGISKRDTSYHTIVVKIKPSINIIPTGNISICQGDSLHMAINGSSGSFRWYLNGNQLSNSTNYLQVNYAGNFYASVTLNGCSANSDTVNLTVKINPAIPNLSPFGAASICQNDSLSLSSTSTLNKQWFFNSAPIPNQSSNFYSAKQAGVYQVRVEQGGCFSYSTTLNLTVKSLPVKPSIMRTGNTLTSSANFGNQWYKASSGILVNDTNKTYNPSINGFYYVKATANGCTSVSSDSINYVKVSNVELSKKNVLIYPNPFTTEIAVSSNSNIKRIEVLDGLGRILIHQTYNSGNTQNLKVNSDLNAGIYFIRVYTFDGFYVQKIVKE